MILLIKALPIVLFKKIFDTIYWVLQFNVFNKNEWVVAGSG